jgi:hypothetical protein
MSKPTDNPLTPARLAELRRLAEQESSDPVSDSHGMCVRPSTVLALIAAAERLREVERQLDACRNATPVRINMCGVGGFSDD